MVTMTGRQVKEHLERELGFETNRARLLTEAAASSEIATYWERRNFGELDERTYSAFAKASLVAGVAGRQKLSDLITKLGTSILTQVELSGAVIEISALVLDHQKTLNLSRNRASCVNAHLNVLEPDRSLPQVYSSYFSASELNKFISQSNELLKVKITNGLDFQRWIKDVHKLLATISNSGEFDEAEIEVIDSSRKGLISRKAIATYLKQWELFALEKLGPNFSIEVLEKDASPLTGRLNNLERGASRTWTTILEDITEAKTSAVFQKRVLTATEQLTHSANVSNLDSYDLEINGRPLRLQLSANVSKEMVSQFAKATRAQFLAYGGKGPFNVSLQTGGSIITASLTNAVKSDLQKIDEMLRQLI